MHFGRQLQRQPRLADATGTGQRQQSGRAQQCPDFIEFTLPADEGGQLLRQVVRRRLQRAQCGKFLAQRRVHHLVDALRTGEVAQAHRSQLAQRDAVGQATAHQCRHCMRQQYLPTMRSVRDARGAVHHAAEEVVVASLGPARMQSGAHAHHDTRRGSGIGESGLDRQRGDQRVDGVVERRVHAVAAHLDDDPVVAFHRLPRDCVVASQRQAHPLGVPLPELAAAFDVREQEGGDGRHDFHAGTPFGALCDGFEVYRHEARGTSAGPARRAGHCNSRGRPLSSVDHVAPT